MANPPLTIWTDLRGSGHGAQQVVHLNAAVVKTLRAHLEALPESSPALFQSCQGRRIRPRQVQLRFARWRRLAYMQRCYTAHSLRHTFATRLYRQTREIRLVQQALGHRRVSSTEVYTAVADNAVQRAVVKLRF